VRLRLGAAHARADASAQAVIGEPDHRGPSEPAHMPWTMRTFLCFGVVMSTSSRCMSSNT
jgi:hypothetical protein